MALQTAFWREPALRETSNQTATFPAFFFTLPEPATAPQPGHNMYSKRATSDENVKNGSTGVHQTSQGNKVFLLQYFLAKQLTSPSFLFDLAVFVD